MNKEDEVMVYIALGQFVARLLTPGPHDLRDSPKSFMSQCLSYKESLESLLKEENNA